MTYQFPSMNMFEKGIQSLGKQDIEEIAEKYTKEVNMIEENHLEREIIWEMP